MHPVAHQLLRHLGRGRIDAAFRTNVLADLAELSILTDPETNLFAWTDTLIFADRFRLTVYDACYLELAQRRGLPLASLDREMRAAGSALGIELLGA